ncbi:MAG: response regulator [Lachnospiraceae bacterium]|nr:response regulator [Lachnospiraceae bacterium]
MTEILLVEDDPDIAENIQDYLTAAGEGGWRIHISDNGEDGLELASQTLYSIILLDIGLPERDGFEICRNLRRRGIQTRYSLSPHVFRKRMF